MEQLRDQELINKVVLRIKTLREERGISQEKLADEISLKIGRNFHIARIETGKVNISLSSLSAICKHFNISMADFFLGI